MNRETPPVCTASPVCASHDRFWSPFCRKNKFYYYYYYYNNDFDDDYYWYYDYDDDH